MDTTFNGANAPMTDEEFEAMLDEAVIEPEGPRFKPETLADLFARPEKPWLIQDIIGAGDIGMIYGAPGCGKTFVTVDLIFSACTGQPFAGRFAPVKALNVAYCAGEGVSGLKDRFIAAATHYNTGDFLPGFTFFADVPQLFDGGADSIHVFIAEQKERQERGGAKLDLLIIDTLHSATTGADENSAQDMGRVLSAAKLAAKELGCAVLIIHHTNKAGTGERGSSAMRGAMDVMIEVKGDEGTRSIHCAKLKDGKEWLPQGFDLVEVDGCDSVAIYWDKPQDGAKKDGRENADKRRAVLVLLDGLGPLNAKDIATHTAEKPNATNNLLTRMVERGLLVRTKVDKKPITFALTEAGKAALQEDFTG